MTYQRACSFGDCVEIEFTGNAVHIRDSKNPDGPVLRFTREEWEPFVRAITHGYFHWDSSPTWGVR